MREYRVRWGNITIRTQKKYLELNTESKNTQRITDFVRSTPIKIDSFHDLVIEIAELAYNNPDVMLFYRGQKENIINKKYATLYPNLFRNDNKSDVLYNIDLMEVASDLLIEMLDKNGNINGIKDLKKIKKIRYAILQHYQVCDTHFLDVTQSIRVACSFASINNQGKGYIYVLALPYLTGRISINSEDDIANLRLLSICTNFAKRPFFQEGYLVGTEYIQGDYDSKSELDFNRRLISIYEFDVDKFWSYSSSDNPISFNVLFPNDDPMIKICNDVKEQLFYRSSSTKSIGDFLLAWNLIESKLLRASGEKNVLFAINALLKQKVISEIESENLHGFRLFRNQVVHNVKSTSQEKVSKALSNMKEYENINFLNRKYGNDKL